MVWGENTRESHIPDAYEPAVVSVRTCFYGVCLRCTPQPRCLSWERIPGEPFFFSASHIEDLEKAKVAKDESRIQRFKYLGVPLVNLWESEEKAFHLLHFRCTHNHPITMATIVYFAGRWKGKAEARAIAYKSKESLSFAEGIIETPSTNDPLLAGAVEGAKFGPFIPFLFLLEVPASLSPLSTTEMQFSTDELALRVPSRPALTGSIQKGHGQRSRD